VKGRGGFGSSLVLEGLLLDGRLGSLGDSAVLLSLLLFGGSFVAIAAGAKDDCA
jgi:hypothetical protein